MGGGSTRFLQLFFLQEKLPDLATERPHQKVLAPPNHSVLEVSKVNLPLRYCSGIAGKQKEKGGGLYRRDQLHDTHLGPLNLLELIIPRK